MKQFLFFLSFLINSVIFSQDVISSDYKSMIGMYKSGLSQRFGEENIIIDDNIHIKNYAGSPLLLQKWSKAEALFNDGELITLPNVNYDALDDLFLIYLKNYKPDYNNIASDKFPFAAITSDNLIAVALTNDEDGTVRFVQVSPGRFATKPKTRFFEYFTVKPKDAYILRSIHKKVKKNHMRDMAYSSSQEDFEFKQYSTYYIKNKYKTFVPVRLGRKAVIKAIDDPEAVKTLKKYIKKQQLKMSNPKDVQKLLAYYFSL